MPAARVADNNAFSALSQTSLEPERFSGRSENLTLNSLKPKSL